MITDDRIEFVAEATYAALKEVRRRDLADLVAFATDDDGATWYLEPLDDVTDDDFVVMSKAVRVASGDPS